MSAAPPGKPSPYDPVYLHARREAVVILGLFSVCAIWAVSVCYLDGYRSPGEEVGEIPTVLGMPRWVFWGILVPWLFADAATIWFCFFYMADDDLGIAHEGEDVARQIRQEHDEREEGRDG